LTHNFDVAPNGCIGSVNKADDLGCPIFSWDGACEYPSAMSNDFEVLVLYPSLPFVGVSAFCPLPEGFENSIIH
jgi:hypothetical protein